jgi:uncharacterized membrane protein
MTRTGPSSTSTRPLGVAILAILLGIYGFILFLGGLLIAVLSSDALALAGTQAFGFTGVTAGLVIAILGLIILGVAVGLWHLRLWALALAVIVLLVFVAEPLINVARNVESAGNAIVGIIIPVLLLIYLLAVRRHFD